MFSFIKHSGLRTIVELSLYLGFFLVIGLYSTNSPSWIGYLIIGLMWIQVLYVYIRRRIKTKPGELVLFRRNDHARKTSSTVLGCLLILGSIAWTWGFESEVSPMLLFILVGILLLSEGLLYWPELKISTNSENICIMLNGESQRLNAFNRVQIASESIQFFNDETAVYLLDELALSTNAAKRLETYFESACEGNAVLIQNNLN